MGGSAVETAVNTFGLGTLDFVVIGGVAALAIYWFALRKKNVEVPEVKKLTIAPSMQRADSFDPSIVSKMKKSGKNVVVFYGSQTGTAEEFATRLAKDAARYGMKGIAADPEECEMDDLTKLEEIDNSLAIFCMATYGEGDPTDNAQEMFDWLQEGSNELNGLNYAVFGLGNKTYEHYNKIGVYFDKRLEELGATRVFEIGLGDDDANIEEDFMNWRDRFWPSVCEHFGIEATGEDVNMRQYAVTEHEVGDIAEDRVFTGESARLGSYRKQKPPYDMKNPYLAPVSMNEELHKGGSDRSCMHIEFDITGSKLRYESGDHVAVYPVNNSEYVEAIGNKLSCDLGKLFTLTNVDEDSSKKHPFPCPTTYRTALSHYLDITSLPRTNVLKELAQYASDEEEKQKLLLMGSNTPEGKDTYHKWIQDSHRNIVAVLEDLPSVAIPIDHLCELLPRLNPRYYSISSSPKLHPNHIAITAVLVDYDTPTGRHMKGVTTSWLKLKQPTDSIKPTVPIFVRKSQFRLPFKPSIPVIMIGPGTGLAPFRGFIQDRHSVKSEGKPVGKTILYYGCRYKSQDFIYKDELENYENEGTLTMYVAFSRDGPKKVYVQHLITEHSEEVWKILEEGGHLYVCGDAKLMANDVDKALVELVSTHGAMDTDKATEYLKRMRSRGRYSCDVWS